MLFRVCARVLFRVCVYVCVRVCACVCEGGEKWGRLLFRLLFFAACAAFLAFWRWLRCCKPHPLMAPPLCVLRRPCPLPRPPPGRYQHSNGRFRMRVTTVGGAWQADASNLASVAASFDQEAAAVLMARYAVKKTDAEEPADIMRWLDRALIRLCARVRCPPLSAVSLIVLRASRPAFAVCRHAGIRDLRGVHVVVRHFADRPGCVCV